MTSPNEAAAAQENQAPQLEIVKKPEEQAGPKVEKFVSAEDALKVLRGEHDKAANQIAEGPLSHVQEATPVTQKAEQKLETLTEDKKNEVSAVATVEGPAIALSDTSAEDAQEAVLLDEEEANPVDEEKIVAAMNKIVTERRLKSGAEVDAQSVMNELGRTVLSEKDRKLIAKIRIGALSSVSKLGKVEAPAAAPVAPTDRKSLRQEFAVSAPVQPQQAVEAMPATEKTGTLVGLVAPVQPMAEAAPATEKNPTLIGGVASTERPVAQTSPESGTLLGGMAATERPAEQPVAAVQRESLRQTFSVASAEMAPTSATLVGGVATEKTIGVSPMAESVRVAAPSPEAAVTAVEATPAPMEASPESSPTVPEAVVTMRSAGVEAPKSETAPITLPATPEALSVSMAPATTQEAAPPAMVAAEQPAVAETIKEPEAPLAEALPSGATEAATLLAGTGALEAATPSALKTETPTLVAAEQAKALSLQEKRAIRTEKMNQAREITQGLMEIAGYSSSESIEQRQERMAKLSQMQDKLREFVKANPDFAGSLGDELSKLHGALESNKGLQEQALAAKKVQEDAVAKALEVAAAAAAVGAVAKAAETSVEEPIEVSVTPERLAAEKSQAALEKKYDVIDMLKSDEWSEAYTGYGVDWNKDQWDALTSDRKSGDVASEKEMFKQLRMNAIGNQFKFDQLNMDLKDLGEKIRVAEASGGATELQQLKQQESDKLLELRKVEELRNQNETAERALQSLVNERIAKSKAESFGLSAEEVAAEAALLAVAKANEAQAQERAAATNVVIPTAKKEKLGAKGALGWGVAGIAGGLVGAGFWVGKGIGAVLKGVGWIVDSFAKSKTFGDALTHMWDKATKKLDEAYNKKREDALK